MPSLSQTALQKELHHGRRGGAFFFHGTEEFLRDEAIERTVAAHLDPAVSDFNLDRLQGGDVTPEALASVIATPPMMAEWRVTVVRDVQALTPKAREVLEQVVAAPYPGLALILSASIPPGSRAKFYSILQQHCRSVEFPAVEPLDAPGWLMERAAALHGKEFDADAARTLVAAIGTDLRTLSTEQEKLVAWVGERDTINVEDVRAVCASLPQFDRWEWIDLVGRRQTAEAMRQLPFLLDAGENGVGLIIALGSHLLRIALAAAGGPSALERNLKPHQRWLARRIVPQAREWTVPEVEAALSELLRTDRLLKSASLTDRQAMEELLLRLDALRAARAAAA